MSRLLRATSPADFVYADFDIITPAALENNCTGIFIFAKKVGETNADGGQRCWWNRAPGASNFNSVWRRAWPGGYPIFGANYAEFREDTPLVTGVPEFGIEGGCVFAVCNCDDDTVGSDASHRASIIGTFGGATNHGFNMEYGSDAASTARVLDYDSSGVSQPNQVDFGVSVNDFEKIRVLYAETGRISGGDQKLAMVNLSGDGTTPDPTDTTLTGGRFPGAQNISIGGRVADSATGYTPSMLKRIGVAMIFSGAQASAPERASIYAQLQDIMGKMAITELSSTW